MSTRALRAMGTNFEQSTAAPQWELVRAIGAVLLTPPPDNQHLCNALSLEILSGSEYTDAFVLSLPPYAAIHLGHEGKLGGESLDRISGFWRVLGLEPPSDADHLGTLLMLYAELGDAQDCGATERTRTRLRLAREALLFEHLHSWAPGYLAAVARLGLPAASSWAGLTMHILDREARGSPAPTRLPLALRMAPPPISTSMPADELLDALVAPVRSGLILTHRDLVTCAAAVDGGLRRGERRYALKFLLQQDARATLDWLADHAGEWAHRHTATARPDDQSRSWWAARAARTAAILRATAVQSSTGRDGGQLASSL